MVTSEAKIEWFFGNVKNAFGTKFYDLLESVDIDGGVEDFSRLSVFQFQAILNKLNATFETINSCDVDFEHMLKQFNGEDSLPAIYTDSLLFSSRFTIKYMNEFIAENFGIACSNSILQTLQVKTSQLGNIVDKNNMLLPQKFCNFVGINHGSLAVQRMGESSITALKETSVGKQLCKSHNLENLLCSFFEEIAPKYIEKNYNWKLVKLSSNSCTILGKPKEEVIEKFGANTLLTSSSSYLRAGFLKGLPRLLVDIPTNIYMIKSISNRDSIDLYEIKFDSTYLRTSGSIIQ